jgi:hypothetical protein
MYRYVPLNGDTAGLMVQTDLTEIHGIHLLVTIVVMLRMLSNLLTIQAKAIETSCTRRVSTQL